MNSAPTSLLPRAITASEIRLGNSALRRGLPFSSLVLPLVSDFLPGLTLTTQESEIDWLPGIYIQRIESGSGKFVRYLYFTEDRESGAGLRADEA